MAEHNQEVQQLCEALEQQIQEERQRMEQEVGEPSTPPLPPQGTQHPKPSWVLMSPLPPQSTARSRLHCAVLQRALDARDREVQRLVAAQEEVS